MHTHLLAWSAGKVDDIQQAIVQQRVGGHGNHAGDLAVVGSRQVQQRHTLRQRKQAHK